jgi:hypothetical protein
LSVFDSEVQRRVAYKQPMRMRLLIVTLLAFATSGCASVKPWERGRMAKPVMQLDPEPESTLLEQHVYQYREGSVGGYGGLGGGCGCN